MKARQSMRTNGIIATALVGMIILLSACERAAPPLDTPAAATVPPAGTAASTIAATTIPGIATVLPTTTRTGTTSPASPTTASGTATPAVTATRAAAAATATIRPQVATATAVSPTAVPPTQVPVAQATSSQFPAGPTSGKTMTVKIYLIAINDNGVSGPKIGCNDSVVGVERVLPASSSPLTDSTKYLLGLRGQFYGQSGLYNVFYQSKLTVDSVVLNGTKASFHLRGTLSLGGECDDPRVEAQLKYLALQFPTVKSVEIFINNKLLSSVLGGQ